MAGPRQNAPAPGTVAWHAERCADARRAAIALFRGDGGLPLALDLMGFTPEMATADHLSMAASIVDHQLGSLRAATLFLADGDMCALLDVAAPGMPGQELLAEDPLSVSGWVSFVNPLTDRTGEGPPLPVHALAWARIPSGHPLLVGRSGGDAFLLTAWVASADLVALMGEGAELREGAPRLIPNATAVWAVGSMPGTAYGRDRGELVAEALADGSFGVSAGDVDGEAPAFYQKVLAAFWALSRQPLTGEVAASPGTKSARARFGRAGVLEPTAPVRVVRLRHHVREGGEYEPAGGESGNYYSVRFAVRGHWRAVAYGKGHALRRQQWIAPFVKGPEDAPFHASETVFLSVGDGKKV